MNVKRSLRQPSAGEGEAHAPRATLASVPSVGVSVPSVMQDLSPSPSHPKGEEGAEGFAFHALSAKLK
jgi:hypothetical protein